MSTPGSANGGGTEAIPAPAPLPAPASTPAPESTSASAPVPAPASASAPAPASAPASASAHTPAGAGPGKTAPDTHLPQPTTVSASRASRSTTDRQPPDRPSDTFGAILLAGGRATRVGGAAKPLFEVGGQTLLNRAITAVSVAGCSPITIVGPAPGTHDNAMSSFDIDQSIEWVREDPPFGGPAAALVAALQVWSSREDPAPEWTFVLACDLPRVDAAVDRLLRDIVLVPSDIDGVCLADASARPQWLTGAYRTAVLARAASALPDEGRNAPVRAIVDDLAIAVIATRDDITADVDTWEDLDEARRRFAARETEQIVAENSSRTLPPEALDEWAAALRERFGLEPDALPISLILDLARDVANGVARPAAPFSAFVAGLVAGKAGGSRAEIESAIAAVTELAADWKP